MSTYREAGVDLDAAEALVDDITGSVTASWGSDVVGSFGGFAAGIRIPPGYAAPVLMMSTDGVGTKADVARAAGLLDGLGSDLVAMCIDDLAAAGARPIAMTDYLVV
ncbi:phosphoribosylformylglycinamidine cyclo-ligase, partial [bacterium]|nr:phosphoribosylformylglycinamidine cyclo-ligase [bacterium]